jgi:MFS family permease
MRSAVRETVSGLPSAYWWLWTSTLVNRLGGFVNIILALYLTLERGFSPAFAGLVVSLYGLGGAVAALVGGVLTDRIGRRATMLAAQIGTALTTAALGFARDPLTIAVIAGAVGFTGNAQRPAVQAMVADVVPAADRVRAFSLNYWAVNIGFGVSAAAAGLIAAHGYLPLFLGDAASTLLCGLVVFLRVPETRPAAPPTAGPDAARRAEAGLGAVLRDGRFMAVVAITFLIAIAVQQGSSTMAVAMGESGLPTSQYGLVIGLNGLLVVLGQVPATRLSRGFDRGKLLAAAALLLGWGFALNVFAHSAGFYALTVAIWTIGEIFQAPTGMAVVAELSPVHSRGRYQGMYSLSWSAAAFVGPLAGGLAYDHWGRAMWPACGVLGTLAAVGYWLLLRKRTAATAVGVASDVGGERVAGGQRSSSIK